MFKYNELSDLLNGELVTPIRAEEDNIICLDNEGNEVIYSFDDFDFDKTIEERMFIIEEEPEIEPLPEEKSGWVDDEVLLYNLAKKLGYRNPLKINGYVDVI